MKGFHQIAVLLSSGESKNKTLYNVFLLIFFWSVFDSIMTYATPLLITEKGYSRTAMGLIIGSSSVFGAFFDFILASVFTNIKYRRIFFFMLILCLVYPFLLWGANSISMFLLAMAWWGLYFNLFNFGRFSFVGRQMAPADHAFGFSILTTARSLGVFVAPILAGFLIVDVVNASVLVAAFIFLGAAFLFLFFSYLSNHQRPSLLSEGKSSHRTIWTEVKLWRKLGRTFFPVLLFTFYLNVVDAFFWTLGPIIGLDFGAGAASGAFLTAYALPALLVGWFIGRLTRVWGKRQVAFVAAVFACLLLLLFPVIGHWYSLIVLSFVASLFFAVAWPAIGAVYADFISEKPAWEKEIEGWGDLSNNLGFAVGPALAGFLADSFSSVLAFLFLGLGGLFLSFVLLNGNFKK